MTDDPLSRDAPDAAQFERYRRVVGALATLPLPRPDVCLTDERTRRLAMLVADAGDALRHDATTPGDDHDFTMEHAP